MALRVAAERAGVPAPAHTSGRRAGVHPGAWWLWSIGMAVAAARTTDPLLLVELVAVAAAVVARARQRDQRGRAFGLFLRLGAFVVAIRVVLSALFGNRLPGHVVLHLPSVALPAWAAGVSIGGPVTAQQLVSAGVTGLQLAAVLACFGAANAMASPYRLLRTLPAALYESAVMITVALTYTPELLVAIGQVRDARRLRGRSVRGFAGLRGIAVPVLESSLDRSLALAASMDARGFGRSTTEPPRAARRRARTASVLAASVTVPLALYAVLAAGALAPIAVPLGVAGLIAVAAAVRLTGRAHPRTRYRPDPWGRAAWAVCAGGATAAAVLLVAGIGHLAPLAYGGYPLTYPSLPLLPAAGIAAGLLPLAVVDRTGRIR